MVASRSVQSIRDTRLLVITVTVETFVPKELSR